MGPIVGSLCSGYGGLELALGAAGIEHRLAWVADPDQAAAKVLARHYPHALNLGDITAVDWSAVELVDMVLAGWPCQPWSVAGKRKGFNDERAIWPAVAHAIRTLRPGCVLLENVSRIAAAGELARVVADLASLGYVGSWRSVRASDVGAAHKRERIFIYAWPADTEGIGHWYPRTEGGQGIPAATVGGDPRALMPTPTAARYGNNQSPSRGAAVRYGLDSINALLPTPRTSDANGTGCHGEGGVDLRTAVAMLPTPRARDHKGRDPNPRGVDINAAVALLPTPRASANENRQTKRTPSQDAGNHGRNLAAEICSLLPTPRATDGTHGGPNQRGSSGDLMLPAAVQPGRWGHYGAAVQRWSGVAGRPAPEPTEPNGKGGQRLAPRFVEWLMGLPEGWVCDVPGLSRNDQLRLLGNGVVPQQGAQALRLLAHLGSAVPA